MTTIPTVKALLVGAWSTALSGVQVVYGPLASAGPVGSTALSVGDVTGRVDVSSLSQQSSTETYAVNCLISVVLSTNNEQMPTDACLQVFADAAAAVRGIALDNVSVTVSGDFELSESLVTGGRAAELSFPVSVFAVF